MPSMKVAVLYTDPPVGARLDEEDGQDQVRLVTQGLAAMGHLPVPVPFTLNLENVAARLAAEKPDLVFNLVEAVGGRDRLLYLATALLDHLSLPYTGATTETLFFTTNKIFAKRLMKLSGIRTPPWYLPGDKEPFQPGEYIVKSIWEHGSLGLDQESVQTFTDRRQMEDFLSLRRRQLKEECFAELFIAGREFNISLLGSREDPEVLPVAEIEFIDYPAAKRRIVDYAAKWDPQTWEYEATRRRFSFPPEDADLLTRLRAIALSCWRLFDMRGYGRIDFRVDPQGRPWALEVNANPGLGPDAGFPAAAALAGWDFPALLERIILEATSSPGTVSHNETQRCQERPSQTGMDTSDRVPELTFREDLTPGDLAPIKNIVASTGFFDEAELAIAIELVEERLAKGAASGYHFILAEKDGELIGYSCFGLIGGTADSYDLYWLAVHNDRRGAAVGRRLLAVTEQIIAARGGRRVYVDTASRDQYTPTRAFYLATGYREEAYLPDFYRPGDGKVIYLKILVS